MVNYDTEKLDATLCVPLKDANCRQARRLTPHDAPAMIAVRSNADGATGEFANDRIYSVMS